MQISSTYAYVAVLSLATLVMATAGILWRVRKEPGQRIFYRDLAIVFAIAFYIPGIIFFFRRDMSVWWLAIPVLVLVLAFKRLIAALFWKSVPLIRIQLEPTAQTQDGALKIVHLSDLHLCAAATTLEGGLASERVIEANRKALKWALQQSPDLIAITGDITDTGASAEWESFESLVNEQPEQWRDKIVFVPGNHDLAIQQRRFGAENDGNALLDYDNRCMAFVRAYFALMPATAKAVLVPDSPTERKEVELQSLFAFVRPSLDAYSKFPPRVQNSGEMLRGLSKDFKEAMRDPINEIEWRHPLSGYVPGIVIPDELRANFVPSDKSWPTEKYPLVLDLLQWLYPLIVFENDRMIVVALNSNTTPSSWLADGALGQLGTNQLIRLALMLHSRPKEKIVVVLVHHHIGCPPDIQRHIARTMVELKALQLHEGPDLARVLQEHGAPAVLLHGHKHVGYAARANQLTVLSGASVPYGDKLGGANCNAFSIDERGGVTLHARTNISCAV